MNNTNNNTNKDTAYIYHHLGLGDHILCNGLVREIIKNNTTNYKTFVIFAKRMYCDSITFMYRDLPNAQVMCFDRNGNSEDHTAVEFLKTCPKDSIMLYGFGFPHQEWKVYDEWLYHYMGVDYSKRWSSFFVSRDLEREKNLFNTLNPNNKKYSLIHGAASDCVNRLNTSFVNTDLLTIHVRDYTTNIFDFLTLIENAEEIHCVQSCFSVLVDSYKIDNNIKLYYHNNMHRRGYSHQLQNNFIEV